MMVLVTYDVAMDAEGPARLRRISKVCVDYGIRAQYSVFECEVDPAQWAFFRDKLLDIYDEKKDSLRFYKLGAKWKSKVEHHGAKPVNDLFRDPLII